MTEPHRLVTAGRRWYLVAWDAGRDDWRTFRVDRLDEVAQTGVRFAERELPEGDAAAYVAEALRTAFASHHAVVRLHAPLAVAAEKLPVWAGVLEADGEDACIYRSAADSLEWIALSVGALGLGFEVLEPPELAACVRTIGERFARASRA
jgi:predicted DNA-binding transcriptional regulator YafY